MKIAVIIDSNPWLQSTASANRWLSLLNGLRSQLVDIRVFIYGGFRCENEAAEWGDCGFKDKIEYKYIEPKLIVGYWHLRFNMYIGFRLRRKFLVKRLSDAIRNDSEIVWTDSSVFGLNFATYLRKNFSEYKLFIEISEYFDIHRFSKGNILQRWKGRKRQNYFEKRAINSFDGIAFMTKTLLLHYKKLMQTSPNLLHLPMTVDLDRFSEVSDTLVNFKKPYIAFVGVMDNAKDGVNILIKAFSRICNDYPELSLYLVGSWNYDIPANQELLAKLDIEDRVRWVGEFPRDAIPAIICNAKLLALPRPDSKQAQGGFPTKLGEYLATGRPVCATTVGEIPEYLEDNRSVYFAKPGSVESFENAMKKALQNDERANMVGEHGKKAAELHFNKKTQSETLYNFLKRI